MYAQINVCRSISRKRRRLKDKSIRGVARWERPKVGWQEGFQALRWLIYTMMRIDQLHVLFIHCTAPHGGAPSITGQMLIIEF